jgi:hypothetical protein
MFLTNLGIFLLRRVKMFKKLSFEYRFNPGQKNGHLDIFELPIVLQQHTAIGVGRTQNFSEKR